MHCSIKVDGKQGIADKEACGSQNMKKKSGNDKNYILVFAVMAVNVLIMGVLFDFYYDLNDDTMMHDIMSGVYSGTPDGHNMQTLYPLGILIAFCYRLCRTVPWYGLFLCLCQFGCFCLVGVRLCALLDRPGALPKKTVLLFLLELFQWGICLPHLVSIQYTVTCAVMSAAAIFLFLTTEDGLEIQQFVVKNIPAILLVILAFQLRSEMLLLTFPFICLAGLYRMAEEKKVLAKESLFRYGAVLGIMLGGMLLSVGADRVAYGGRDWKDFRNFFDARTTVYDFYPELVTDDAYGGKLTELGVTPNQQELLRNYNFGLDDQIDTEMLCRLADYAADTLGAAKDWASIMRSSIFYYYYRTFHSQDAPYNMTVLWAYAAVFAVGMCACRRDQNMAQNAMGRYAFLWQLLLLAAVRSAVWMFILMRGRDPVRITHSLYLVEFALLAAMFVRQCCRVGIMGLGKQSGGNVLDFGRRSSVGVMRGIVVVFVWIMAMSVPGNIEDVQADQVRRTQVNKSWYAIDAYCRMHEENFYFEDVYSTVEFSHKMFGDTDNSYANYDILGGWMCKSPLYYEKLRHYGIDFAGEALLHRSDVYLIVSDAEMAERGIGWAKRYYEARGNAVMVDKVDKIDDYYSVYRIQKAE